MTEETIEIRYQKNIDFQDIITCEQDSQIINVKSTKKIRLEENILEFKDINFKKIHFMDEQYIYNGNLKGNLNNIQTKNKKIIFEECVFETLIISEKLSRTIVFKNCKFNDVTFKHLKEEDEKFSIYFSVTNNNTYIGNFINKLSIHMCVFNKKFYINDTKHSNERVDIGTIIIKESDFQNNFKLHNSNVKKIKLENINFHKTADFFKSKFLQKENINFKLIKFEGLALFDECEFHGKFILEYITFSALSHFRQSIFYNGLDLDKTNIEKEMNFYGVIGLDEDNNVKETSQETYRIIKYNCEGAGNAIDANKYHALELKKRKEKLEKQNRTTQESIVFYIHWEVSRFGTDWLRPLLGIIILGFITLLLLHGNHIWTLFNKPTLIEFLQYIGKGINKAFGYMYILNRDKEFQEHSIVFLLNKITLGYLYYQFVTAVRKDTRK